jgi:chromate transporter
MLLLLDLFLTFLMIGAVSFGGGYSMIPLIQEEVVERHHWMTIEEFTDVIAVASMSPGPIATNSAIFIGYQQAGVIGAIISTLGTVLPSLLIILAVAGFFVKLHNYRTVKSAFYGLRAVITGLIIYAAIVFAGHSYMGTVFSWLSFSLIIIFLLSLYALIKLKIHPLSVIILSGVIGVVMYN